MYIDIWNLIFYIIGIPLVVSIVANLLTRYPEKFLANYSMNNSRKNVIRKLKYIEELEHYKEVPTEYHTFMLNMILRIVVEWSGFIIIGSFTVVSCWLLLSYSVGIGLFSFLLGFWVWLAGYVMLILYKLVRDLTTSFQVYSGIEKIKSLKQSLGWTIDKTMRKHPDWLEGIYIPEDVWRDHEKHLQEIRERLDEAKKRVEEQKVLGTAIREQGERIMASLTSDDSSTPAADEPPKSSDGLTKA